MSRLIVLAVAMGLLSACASRPQHIEGKVISALSYIDHECPEISQEVFNTVGEIKILSNQVDQIADDNHIRTTAWWWEFPITMLAEYDSGDTQEALRLKYLKGNYLALQQAAQFNQCDNMKVQPLSAFITNKYYLSEDDKAPYKKVKISASSQSVLRAYDASGIDKKSKFEMAVTKLESFLKHNKIGDQEYRYVVSLLLDKHTST